MASGPLQVRLQKVLARAGIASRRAAEELIAAGRVRVDGRVVTELGTKVDSRASRIEVDGVRIARESAVYIVLHKPRGAVSTMNDPQGRPTVRDLFENVPGRVFPVGRLDFNTSGVLFATNDGDFAEGLMHPRRAVPKSYVVKLQGLLEDRDLETWRRGVVLEDGKTLPAKVKLLRHEADKTWIELTITEGRNQQVRRMGDATGFRVMRLARTAFAGVSAEGLRPGDWRYLSADELATLKKDFGVPKRVVSPPADRPRARRAPPKRSVHEAPADRPPPPRHGGGGTGRREPAHREDWGGRALRRGPSTPREDEAAPRPPEQSRRGGPPRAADPRAGVGAARGTHRARGRPG